MTKLEALKKIEENKALKEKLLETVRIGGDMEEILKTLEAAGITASIHDVQAFLDKNTVKPLSDDELEAASGGCGDDDPEEGEVEKPVNIQTIITR